MDDLDATSPTGDTGKHSFAQRPAGDPFPPSPLARVDMHLLALRERIDNLTVEHELLVRWFRVLNEHSIIHVEDSRITADTYVGFEAFDLDKGEALILRSLLAD